MPATALVSNDAGPLALTPAAAGALTARLKWEIGEWLWKVFPDEADDVLGDTWEVILGRLGRGQALAALEALAPIIARDARCRFFRRRGGGKGVRRAVPLGNTDPPARDAGLARVELDDALAALPDSVRTAAAHKWVHGYTREEVAELMDTSPGQVAGWLRDARKALPELLGAD